MAPSVREESRQLLREGEEERKEIDGKDWASFPWSRYGTWPGITGSPVACHPIDSSRPHVCHALTLDLQQLVLQPAAGTYLSSVVLKTEPEQNVIKSPALDINKRKMEKDLSMWMKTMWYVYFFKHRFGIFSFGFWLTDQRNETKYSLGMCSVVPAWIYFCPFLARCSSTQVCSGREYFHHW